MQVLKPKKKEKKTGTGKGLFVSYSSLKVFILLINVGLLSCYYSTSTVLKYIFLKNCTIVVSTVSLPCQ